MFRLQIGTDWLRIQDDFFSRVTTFTLQDNWALRSWVYIYLYSDGVNSIKGFGCYTTDFSPPLNELTQPGTFDMAAYEGNHFLRVGTKNNDSQNVSTIRKLVVFKGRAIS